MVTLHAELAIEKMQESNAALRMLDPELRDELLRESITENEACPQPLCLKQGTR